MAERFRLNDQVITADFEHSLCVPQTRLFEFHEDPASLAVLLEGWPGFRLLHHDGRITPDSETWVEVMVAKCIPMVMGFRHTVYEPPRRFAERLIHGPFRIFEHIHSFEDKSGVMLVHDRVRLALSWPYGGLSATRALVLPALRRFFAFRHAAMDRLFLAQPTL